MAAEAPSLCHPPGKAFPDPLFAAVSPNSLSDNPFFSLHCLYHCSGLNVVVVKSHMLTSDPQGGIIWR